jgi:glycosyltransferase involved in cell wall biosynthesis
MRFLINLIPIKSGGGQQVASNFITHAPEFCNGELVYLTTKGSHISSLLVERGAEFVEVEDSLFNRFLLSYFHLKKIVKDHNVDVIYTLFGPGLFVKNIPSITGCAYSNLFFPEIDFWFSYKGLQKVKHKLIDWYRLKNTLKSDAIIFENEAMQKRCYELFNYPREKTTLILPSISSYPNEKYIQPENSISSEEEEEKPFVVLLLTGWHPNKNIEIIPHILKSLADKGCTSVKFHVTVDKEHEWSMSLKEKGKELNIWEHIELLGAILPENIPIVIQNSDAIGLFSLLESFSNNIIEAWHFKKPLLISDEEWSRAICKDAAVYVDRMNPHHIAEMILKLKNNHSFLNEIVQKGVDISTTYPSPKEKVQLQFEFINRILNE